MNFLQLSTHDLVKGFIMAVLTALVTALYTAISGTSPHWPTGAEWQTIALTALSAGLVYLTKNFLTNSKDQFLKKDPN